MFRSCYPLVSGQTRNQSSQPCLLLCDAQGEVHVIYLSCDSEERAWGGTKVTAWSTARKADRRREGLKSLAKTVNLNRKKV